MVGYPRERFTITLHSCGVIGGIAPLFNLEERLPVPFPLHASQRGLLIRRSNRI